MPPDATQLFILIYWEQLLKWMKYHTSIAYLLIYILIQGLQHGTRSVKIWIYYSYQSKHTKQKSLQKYMKFWKSRLAKLNNIFDSYIKENYKVVEYHVKTPTWREHNLTWRPYGYYKKRNSRIALRLDQLWMKKEESEYNLTLTSLTF